MFKERSLTVPFSLYFMWLTKLIDSFKKENKMEF